MYYFFNIIATETLRQLNTMISQTTTQVNKGFTTYKLYNAKTKFFTKKSQLPPPSNPNKKTLVLDLDETLVHSNFIKNTKTDFTISVNIKTFCR